MKEKSIYDLKLHEETGITRYLYVTRVPGGWIYTIYEFDNFVSQLFVPFNNEFQDSGEIFKDTLEQLDGLNIRGEK